jgi:hypothetical protein
MKYESTLAQISSEVFSAKTADEAKQVIVLHLEGTRVKDKAKMIADVSRLQNLTKVWTYYTNSLLRFEALSVNPYGTQE